MEDCLEHSSSSTMTTKECDDFYKNRPYSQQKEQPTGFCKICGRIPSQCECNKEKQK